MHVNGDGVPLTALDQATTIWSAVIIAQCTVMVLTLRAKNNNNNNNNKRGGLATGVTSKVVRSIEMAAAAEAIDGVFAVRGPVDGDGGDFTDDGSDSEDEEEEY